MSGILLPESLLPIADKEKKIRVLVWDERSDAEKEAYDNFLGNYIADQLKLHTEFTVVSAGLNDPDSLFSRSISSDGTPTFRVRDESNSYFSVDNKCRLCHSCIAFIQLQNSSSYGHHFHIDYCSCHRLQILLSTTKSREHSWRVIQTWRRQIMLSDQGSRISNDYFVRYSFADWDKRRGPLRETIHPTLVTCLS